MVTRCDTYEIDRKEEPDGVRLKSPTGDNKGLGVGRNYSYISVFDGQNGKNPSLLADGLAPRCYQSNDDECGETS